MILSRAIDLVHRGLGFRSDLADVIQAEMKEQQEQLELGRTLPEFLLVQGEAVALTAGRQTYPVPDNFIVEYEDGGLQIADDVGLPTGRFLTKAGLDTAQTITASMNVFHDGAIIGTYPEVATRGYNIIDRTLYIFPTPAEDGVLIWSYYAHDIWPAASDTNKWLSRHPHLLVGYTGQRIADDLRDANASAAFAKVLTRAETLYQMDINRDLDANRTYALGSEL